MTSTNGSQRAFLNLYDMPELLPGAQPSANPAQRDHFEERCRQLHEESEIDRAAEAEAAQQAAGAGTSDMFSELEAMFPNLDASLIRSIRSEAQSAGQAIEVLLQLSVAAASVGDFSEEGEVVAVNLPPLSVGVEDHEKFPSLVDADGWQVASSRQFEKAGDDADLGSEWRDRAKAAADIKAPKVAPVANAWTAAAATKRREKALQKQSAVPVPEEPHLPLTEYEIRHQAGQRRAKRRTQYSKAARGGRGREGGGGPGQSPAAARRLDATESDSESELSDEEAPVLVA